MNKFTQLAYLSFLWVVAFAASASAQEAPRVSPNFEIRYTTEGAGFESNASVEALIPIFQTPGENATFLQGKLFLDNDSQMGGNVLLGHRIYNEGSGRVTGGYVSLDARDTGSSYFKQLGFGFESLGNWDLRINGYLPLGDTRNQVGQFFFGSPFFQGNNIFLQQAHLFEVALHGVDAEIGTSLTKIGSGDLRGYAGLYYLGNDNKEAFGWKARVEARPSKFLSVGASLQNDSLFDTRAVLTVGLSFPGSGETKSNGDAEKPSNFARMGEFVQRQPVIPVVGDSFVTSPALINPVTGQAWSFVHVGTGNSNGTFESPFSFNQIQQAVNEAARTNSVVYIRGNATAIVPAFTLPTGVQVITNAPERFINTAQAGSVKLPFSGSGVLPKLGGAVILSNNTTLSGFDINAQSGASVRGTNISNVTITNNSIQGTTLAGTSTTQGEAILLSQVTGNVDISNNTINRNAGNAVSLNNTSGNVNLRVTSNRITDNFNSIGVNLAGTATGTAEISSNTISNSGIGVDVSLSGNANLSRLNIANNTITAPNSDNPLGGIKFTAFDNASAGNVNVTGNTIRNTSNDGIGFKLNGNTTAQINIANNRIENVKGSDAYFLGGSEFSDGIDVQLFDNASAGISITGNTVNNTTGRGISTSNYSNAANLRLDITGNTVSNTEYQGIGFELGGRTTAQVNIANNKIENVKGSSAFDVEETEYADGISVELFNNANSTISITGNTVNNTAGRGIGASNYGNAANLRLDITNNTVSNNKYEGISFDNSNGSGNVNINNNTINKNASTAVLVNNASGTVNLQVTGNRITDNFNSIGVNFAGNSAGIAEIARNTISNSGIGVDVTLSDNANFTRFNISDNAITASNSDNPLGGIKFTTFDSANATVNVTGNTIRNTSNDGIGFELNGNTRTQINILNNRIENVKGSDAYFLGGAAFADGIDIQLFDTASAGITITGNTVDNTTGRGISTSNYGNAANLRLDIRNNTVSNTGYAGIGVDNFDGNMNANITSNTIRNVAAGENAIQVESAQSSRMCVAIDSNGITSAPGGSRLTANAATLEVVNATTLSTRNGGATFSTTGTTNRTTPCP
ncbi:MAG: right-handed parallel beta-helix repeat-containing protein [Calothrix sp. C42_A2020_038]|nr:right-handed parallel beta-helix repeat-containing protein [Calothrix sp. C42_A2020_038]